MEKHENLEHFDKAAATWDEKPQRVEMTKNIAQAIIEHIELNENMSILEYGCGTANLSFAISPLVGKILATDASEGMVEQTRVKISAGPTTNISTQKLDLITDPLPTEKFSLICTAMAMHHISDISTLLKKFAQVAIDGAQLALVDLYKEDGSFHRDCDVPHNGFDPQELEALLIQAGFEKIKFSQIYVIKKPLTDESIGKFPIFLCTARKK